MAFTHIAPGFVRTGLMKGQSNDWLMRAFSPLTSALGYLAANSADDCGEYMWHALYSGDKGVFRRDNQGNDIGDRKLFSSEEAKTKLWDHSLSETSPRE